MGHALKKALHRICSSLHILWCWISFACVCFDVDCTIYHTERKPIKQEHVWVQSPTLAGSEHPAGEKWPSAALQKATKHWRADEAIILFPVEEMETWSCVALSVMQSRAKETDKEM